MAGAAAFSVQQSSRAGKEMVTWQRQSGKSKLSVIQDTLENKKPGILFPVLKEMKKELNNQGLSTKQPKHSSQASFLEVLQAGLHLCVQGPCTASKSPPEMLPIKSGIWWSGFPKRFLWCDLEWASLLDKDLGKSLFAVTEKNLKKLFCGEYTALLLFRIA